MKYIGVFLSLMVSLSAFADGVEALPGQTVEQTIAQNGKQSTDGAMRRRRTSGTPMSRRTGSVRTGRSATR